MGLPIFNIIAYLSIFIVYIGLILQIIFLQKNTIFGNNLYGFLTQMLFSISLYIILSFYSAFILSIDDMWFHMIWLTFFHLSSIFLYSSGSNSSKEELAINALENVSSHNQIIQNAINKIESINAPKPLTTMILKTGYIISSILILLAGSFKGTFLDPNYTKYYVILVLCGVFIVYNIVVLCAELSRNQLIMSVFDPYYPDMSNEKDIDTFSMPITQNTTFLFPYFIGILYVAVFGYGAPFSATTNNTQNIENIDNTEKIDNTLDNTQPVAKPES